MTQVLLVEDDSQIAKSLSINLNFNGYHVTVAESLAEAWSKLTNLNFDILLLDVGLPDGTGIELCQRFRAAGKNTPVIFLSARTDEKTVVEGISKGGDDYIRKPFGTEELIARMKRILNRVEPIATTTVVVGPLTLDFDKRSVMLYGKFIDLGKRQFDILAILAKRAGDVVTREIILDQLGHEVDLFDRTIDSHISQLRSKLRKAGDEIQISAVYGIGYRLKWK